MMQLPPIEDRIIDFSVKGKPVGKQRPRVTMRGGHPHIYTPEKTAHWEDRVAWAAQQCWGVEKPPMEIPLRLWVAAVMPRPRNLNRYKDPEGFIWRAKTPDGDNVLKSIADGIVKAKVIADDKWIVDWQVLSLYSPKGKHPGFTRAILTAVSELPFNEDTIKLT